MKIEDPEIHRFHGRRDSREASAAVSAAVAPEEPWKSTDESVSKEFTYMARRKESTERSTGSVSTSSWPIEAGVVAFVGPIDGALYLLAGYANSK